MVSRPLKTGWDVSSCTVNKPDPADSMTASKRDEPEISDVDEGVVEGGEDTSNAKNEFACKT